MPVTSNHKIQRIIQLLGFLALPLGIWTMLRVPTLILPPWFLVVIFLPMLLGVSFLLAIVTKHLIKNDWSKRTYTAIYAALFCIAFYISEYVPTRTITVADSFSGEVKLLLSKDKTDQFELNEYGIGYISEATYRKGFAPKVVKAGKDITPDNIRTLRSGTVAYTTLNGKTIGPYKYLGFIVPGQPTDSLANDLSALIERHAIDTTRLYKD